MALGDYMHCPILQESYCRAVCEYQSQNPTTPDLGDK